ncbi:MAG: flagellar biosynthesis protein FlhG [Polyangiales bacterium]
MIDVEQNLGFGPVKEFPDGDYMQRGSVASRSIRPSERSTLNSMRINTGPATVSSIVEPLEEEEREPPSIVLPRVNPPLAEDRPAPPSGSDQAAGLRLVRSPSEEDQRVLRFRRKGHGGPCRSFAVTSGKGGVGKTQFAANLAVAFAKRGLRVLMLDADVGLASLDLALGVKPHDDLRAVVRGDVEIEEILCEGPEDIHLVPACPGRYDMANMTDAERARLQTAVDELATEYDVLITDTGAGIGSSAVSFAASADEVLLVVTPDPTSLRDAYAMAKVLHRRSGVDRVSVVCNQVTSDAQGLEVFERLEQIVRRFMSLHVEYVGCIPMHSSVREAVADGMPYVIRAPQGQPARAVRSIARRVLPPTLPKQVS